MIRVNISLGLSAAEVKHLHTLAQVNVDCRDCFREAMVQSTSPEIRVTFAALAKECGHHADALRNLLSANADTPPTSTSMRGAADCLWMSLRATFGDTSEALLSEAHRIAEYAEQCYVQTLQSINGRAVRQLISEQLAAVRKSAAHIQNLRDHQAGRSSPGGSVERNAHRTL